MRRKEKGEDPKVSQGGADGKGIDAKRKKGTHRKGPVGVMKKNIMECETEHRY